MTPVLNPDTDSAEWPVKPAQEVQRLRRQDASVFATVSPWRVVLAQVGLGAVVVVVAWLVTQRANVAWSAAYGVLTAVVPAALFARGLQSRFSSPNAATAGLGFFVWEALKIALSVGMLVAANRLVADLDWLALLIGLVVSLKVYWVVPWLPARRKMTKVRKS